MTELGRKEGKRNNRCDTNTLSAVRYPQTHRSRWTIEIKERPCNISMAKNTLFIYDEHEAGQFDSQTPPSHNPSARLCTY